VRTGPARLAALDGGALRARARQPRRQHLLDARPRAHRGGQAHPGRVDGNGSALLMEHAEQREQLRDEPALWPNAVDEMLRFDSPVQRTGRIAQRDTEVAGVPVPAGQPVMTLLGGANRDPEVFAEPQRFDVARPNAGEHVAFSSGIHYCLGAGLARMEGEVGLRALLERFPDLAAAGAPHRRATRVLRGYETMPVRLFATASL